MRTSLEELKAMLAPHFEEERLVCSAFQPGIPKGAITQLSGIGKTEWTIRFLQEQAELNIGWVESRLSIFPTALAQRKIDLARVVFVEAGDEAHWCAFQLLQTGAFGVLVLESKSTDSTWWRRIQLAAKKSGTVVFWLTDHAISHWVNRLQLRVHRDFREKTLETASVRTRG